MSWEINVVLRMSSAWLSRWPVWRHPAGAGHTHLNTLSLHYNIAGVVNLNDLMSNGNKNSFATNIATWLTLQEQEIAVNPYTVICYYNISDNTVKNFFIVFQVGHSVHVQGCHLAGPALCHHYVMILDRGPKAWLMSTYICTLTNTRHTSRLRHLDKVDSKI